MQRYLSARCRAVNTFPRYSSIAAYDCKECEPGVSIQSAEQCSRTGLVSPITFAPDPMGSDELRAGADHPVNLGR